MTETITFRQEVLNLLHASEGNPINFCIQCGTCSGTCPVAGFMDHSPRQIIAMINAGMKEEVMNSNTFWYCASCYHCTVRCPQEINITGLMYAMKRYSIWKGKYKEGLIGPTFSEAFVKMIVRTGRSFEPVLAPSYIFSFNMRGFLQEVQNATELMLKGRLPLLPARIKRLEKFRSVIGRIIPMGGLE
ncbi:MAG: 4Fe-4S dicluster domain-containing protein [Chloroflexi bacterium]|nr:4Fe-4S dicluster domain-containing protein [Chloroflexota bacterium]